MKDKETEILLPTPQSLISDDYFYKYIFKKTEKIICAVFLILNLHKDKSAFTTLVDDIERTALKTLSYATTTLGNGVEDAGEVAKTISFQLIDLESKLRVLNAAGVLLGEHLTVFVAEIDTVLRSSRTYTKTGEHESAVRPAISARRTVERVSAEAGGSIAPRVKEEGDRRTRILAVLKAQGDASIKDISDTVKDVSEKTIQRELNSLIKDGFIRRSGERRWSKYSIVS